MNKKPDLSLPLRNALLAVQNGPAVIAHELRQMAEAKPPYGRFRGITADISDIWLAAAEVIEALDAKKE